MNRSLWIIVITAFVGGCSTPPPVPTGHVQYHKRVLNEDLTTSIEVRPVVGATVLLERIGDGTLIAETTTDETGFFTFDGSTPADQTHRVRVVAQAIGPRVNITVYQDHDLTLPWSVTNTDSDSFDIDITEPYAAGAFNVIGLAAAMGDVLAPLVPPDIPPPLRVRWSESSLPICGSCFYVDKSLLELTGAPGDEDAHDDSVVLHELAHYLEATWGSYDNPGGRHNREQVGPALAWSEGFATWFQAVMRNAPNYIDLRPSEVYVLDLENPPASTLGIKGELPTALLSEALVYGVLWDLTDASDDEESLYAVEDVLAEVVGLTHLQDVGVIGADFFDFLNDWRCSHNASEDTNSLQALLESVGYPLNFDEEPSCPETSTNRRSNH
jgi:hypothetical protein